MMKKLLLLILVLGISSLTSAELQISVNGDKNPLDSQVRLSPNEEVILDIWTNTEITSDARYYALVANTTQGLISGGEMIVSAANQGFSIFDNAVDIGVIPLPADTNGVWGGVTVFPDEPAIDASSVLFEGIELQCEALGINPGGITIQLLEVDGSTWTVSSVLDQVVIYQKAPELDTTDLPTFYDYLTMHLQFDDHITGKASENKVRDHSSNNYNVTVEGTPLWGKSWENDTSIRLNGMDQAVRIPKQALNFDSGTITLRVIPATINDIQFLIGHQQEQNYICLYTIMGKVALGLGTEFCISTNLYTLEPDTAYDIALTWDSGQYALHINGQIITSGTCSQFTEFKNTIDIGNMGLDNNGAVNMGFNGTLEDVKIFNTELSESQILQLSNSFNLHENKFIEMEITGLDEFGNPLSYSAAVLPAGSAFNQDSQTFSWRPWYNAAGDYQLQFLPSDGSDATTVTLSIDNVELAVWYQIFLEEANKI